MTIESGEELREQKEEEEEKKPKNDLVKKAITYVLGMVSPGASKALTGILKNAFK